MACAVNYDSRPEGERPKDAKKELWCFLGQRLAPLDTVMGRMWWEGRNQAPAQPDRSVEHVQAYIDDVKLASTKFPVSGQQKEKLNKVVGDAEKYRDALAAVLQPTAGKMRIPIKALLFSKDTQHPTWLNVFVCKMEVVPPKAAYERMSTFGGRPHKETVPAQPAKVIWRLVDWTFPTDETLPKQFDASGETDEAAFTELFESWNHYHNKYPPGRLQYQLIYTTIRQAAAFDTDGTTRWDHVVSWLGAIATVALVVSGVGTLCGAAVLLWGVTGEVLASTGMWVMVFSSTAAATINIAQRQALGIGSWKDNAFDGLTIVGNLLAGIGAVARVAQVAEQTAVRAAWARGAYVEFTDTSGVVLKGALIGQVGDNLIQGVLVAEEQMEEYDKLTTDPNISPEERVNRFVTWCRNVAFNGLMTFISFKGSISDLKALQQEAKIAKDAARYTKEPLTVKTPKEKLDLLGNPKERLKITTEPVTEGKVPEPTKKRQVATHTTTAEIPGRGGELKGPDADNAIAESGMVKKHALGTSEVAQEREEVIMIQATNKTATANIETSDTKNMHVKGKSADDGPAEGFIPIDQSLSRKVREPNDALMKKYQTKEAVLAHFNDEVAGCMSGDPPLCVPVKVPSKTPPPDFVEVLGYRPKPGQEARPITADYDLLAVGVKGDIEPVRSDPEMGNISEGGEERLKELNAKLGRTDSPVFHHGAANEAPFDPGINYPVTSFEPSGNIVSIPKGPKGGDPDEELKKYFDKITDEGFNVKPHPDWNWTQDGNGHYYHPPAQE